MEDPPAPTLVGCQALEQFLLLAKSAKGPAVAQLIKHATEANGVYVFGELLECECVEQIRNGPHASSVKLLEIFAYSTYEDYKSKIGQSIEPNALGSLGLVFQEKQHPFLPSPPLNSLS